jgi:hypothetical protein
METFEIVGHSLGVFERVRHSMIPGLPCLEANEGHFENLL